MARPKTRPGRLSDLARHCVLPSGIATTGWPAVRDQCAEWGDVFDEWQDGAGRAILAKRENGLYAATIGGVTLSIPRQVAKTFLVGRIVFALCVLFPGLQVVWTAHRTRTATRTFGALQRYAKRRKVWPHIDHIRTSNGEQEIAFRNGSVIMFGAREQGFGRGFEELDIEVFDEAQILTEKALEDMVAATNQSRHPHGALLFYMGTPPRPVDPGEAFTLKRTKALSGKADDMVYIEMSADPDADPDDRAQWAKANVSYPHRTPLHSMLRLRENLISDEAWRREALGIWDDPHASGALDVDRWASLADPQAERGSSVSFGVATAPDRSWSAVAVAWRRADGLTQVELVDYREGATWVDERVKDLRKAWGGSVTVDQASRGLITGAEEPAEMVQAQAHNMLADGVEAGTIRHGNQPALNVAVRTSRWKPSGNTRVLDRKGSADISPIAAAALAVHGLSNMSVPLVAWR